MSLPILATKLFIPLPRPKIVLRPRLVERLNANLCQDPDSGTKLTLISAPAGFGKTTLVSEWLAGCDRPVAWLSLDKEDNDPSRFLGYLVVAIQTIAPEVGDGVISALQSPQPPPAGLILTGLLNEIATIRENFILVLDDYHLIDSEPIDKALAFLIERLPPQMHLVIATREDPHLPLARLRARSQLTELRAADLRFTTSEAAEFLNRVMGLGLSTDDIAALETRTEGWIAGLQLAAISMQGHKDATTFVRSFTGSHHFVLDYLVEEVLQQQPEGVQKFLLHTSVFDRLCGPLCDAVFSDSAGLPGSSGSGQQTLEYLERANLFIVPLDDERVWYRYHHLFADLLRQRLYQNIASSKAQAERRVNELHIRASQWFEDHDLDVEAFRHAAAANDIDRADRLIEGRGIPLHYRGSVTIILDWLDSLPPEVLNDRPILWWRSASLRLINGQTVSVEDRLRSAEAALAAKGVTDANADHETRNLIGQIAAARATLALTRYDIQGMVSQSARALEYLRPSSMFTRASANWVLGYARLLMGDRPGARQALNESIALSQGFGVVFTLMLATIGLGSVQEADNELYQAAETYRSMIELGGDRPQQILHVPHLGLAHIYYQWNDLDRSQEHAEQALVLAKQYEQVIDRFILCEVFLAHLKLIRGDVAGASEILSEAERVSRERNFVFRIPEVATEQVLVLLRQGNLRAAAQLAQDHKLPNSLARVHLAQGDAPAALVVLEAARLQVEARGLKDEHLNVLVLQAVAYLAGDEHEKAMRALEDALSMAEPGGFIRIFLDEGAPMKQLLTEALARGIRPEYTSKLLAAFEPGKKLPGGSEEKLAEVVPAVTTQPLVEPLSSRELEVLRLVALGLSNEEIGERLFLAVSTVKGHNRIIFEKLQVQRRTEAVARARELGLL